MNIKSITTLGLVAAALAITSVAPAEANSYDNYRNQLAMQMYLQNQAAGSAIYTPIVNTPYVYGAATNPYATFASPYVSYRNVIVPRYVGHNGFHGRYYR